MPETRITSYLEKASRWLSFAVQHVTQTHSSSTAATFLLMTSLGSVFNVLSNTSRHAHLEAARKIIQTKNPAIIHKDQIQEFLTHWYLKLDCFEAHSSMDDNEPWILAVGSTLENIHHVKTSCIWGIPYRMIWQLTNVAEILRLASKENQGNSDLQNRFAWKLSQKLQAKTESARYELIKCDYGTSPAKNCMAEIGDHDLSEMQSLVHAYTVAAEIHLDYRVLRLFPNLYQFQIPVSGILSVIKDFVRNKTVTQVLMFPFVTAGFVARTKDDRDFVIEYCKEFESLGLPHVRKTQLFYCLE